MKIETLISENLKIFGYDLNFITQNPPPPRNPSGTTQYIVPLSQFRACISYSSCDSLTLHFRHLAWSFSILLLALRASWMSVSSYDSLQRGHTEVPERSKQDAQNTCWQFLSNFGMNLTLI